MVRRLPLTKLLVLSLLLIQACKFVNVISAEAQLSTVKELYVKTTEEASCPDQPCHTLDEYVHNVTHYFVSNTTCNFLPGNHNLTKHLNVSNVTNLALVSFSVTANITCQNELSIGFTTISNLTLKDLTFNLNRTLYLTDLLNLKLLMVTMVFSLTLQGPGLNITNVVGISRITGLSIFVSGPGPFPKTHLVEVLFTNKTSWLIPNRNRIMIDNMFLYNCPTFDLTFGQSTYALDLVLDNVTNTRCGLGWNILFLHSSTANNVTMRHLNLNMYSGFTIGDHGDSISSLHFDNCHLPPLVALWAGETEVTFENTLFNDSCFGCIQHILIFSRVILRNVTFSNVVSRQYESNIKAEYGHSIVSVTSASNVSFIDCKFLNNDARRSAFNPIGAVVVLANSTDVNFTNCKFIGNLGTPIASKDSTFILSGTNTFSNNTAYEGGALAFYGQSYVTLSNGSDTRIMNNSAQRVGGAIYNDYYVTNAVCFFEFEYNFIHGLCDSTLPVSFHLSLNDANSGGNEVYGASFDTCRTHTNMCQGWLFLALLFHIDQRNASDFSAVTSDPVRACLCKNGRPWCASFFKLVKYPGESFKLSAVAVGDRFGTVNGSVYSQVLPLTGEGEVAELGDLEYSQLVRHSSCTTVSYTIFSNSNEVTLVLTADTAIIQQYPDIPMIATVIGSFQNYLNDGAIEPVLRSFPVYVNITLLQCPLGFVLSGDPPCCTCDTQLVKNDIFCNLTTQTVQRKGTKWVNASFHNSTSNGVIVSKYCPNNYCKPQVVNVHLEYPDTQCAFNHSGILCGGCQSGLSLSLGSPQCRSCSNKYLALLIPFALAGFVLVFFIKLLNLTVGKGTMNGLIFYANIVRANQVAWNSAHTTNILTVFIAWLNLDLGIESCFFDGLNAYWKTWLQFVFPLYIWAIVILIIILSRYSSTAAKIFGGNSVPVLATLFLLSYPKLLRTIISIFQASTLYLPDGTLEIMWSYDGNVHYFSGKRIPLLLVAVAVTLLLWLPYTGVLLFAQYLQRIPNYHVTHFLLKLKPFLDAYFGPFKDKHRYWVGLLLLVRGVLFVSFAVTPDNRSELNLLITLVVVVCLQVYLACVDQVYKKLYLSVLELSFFLNLSILAGGMLYINGTPGGSRSSLAYVSSAIAFAQFVVICSFHAGSLLKETRMCHLLCSKLTVNRAEYEELAEDEPVPVNERERQQNLMVFSYGEYREPVLKYINPHT